MLSFATQAGELLAEIIADLAKLSANYRHAGLLPGATGADRLGQLLIGERGERLAFNRSLLLVDALLRNVLGSQWLANDPQPWHVTVFGGTQVGKSVCVNVLLTSPAAKVHHIAGFTRHAQGFVSPDTDLNRLFGGNPFTFRDFQRVSPEDLDPNRLDCYSVQQLKVALPLPGCVIWDTPDCDAVDSVLYMAALIEALTLADVTVYVTSKEKYAVNSILEWLVLLDEAGIPLVGCLNLTPRHQQPDIIESHRQALERVARRHGREAPGLDMIAFEIVVNGDVSVLYESRYEPGTHLRDRVKQRIKRRLSQEQRVTQALAFIEKYLPILLQPAQAEIDALEQWDGVVSQGVTEFLESYRKGYLDNAQRYDAFGRVSLRILDLLKPPIPGLMEALSVVRRVLSLPARLILAAGRGLRRWMFGGMEEKAGPVSPEVEVFTEAHQRLLNGLSKLIHERCRATLHHPFWDSMSEQWKAQLEVLNQELQRHLQEHTRRADGLIATAAEAIYRELERSPVTLNALRTSRVAGDAAAIVISIKTGGHGDLLHAVILAPTLMSLMEAIAQAISENYVDRRKRELRAGLLADIQRLAEEVYHARLLQIANEVRQQTGFLQLDAEMIRALPKRIALLRHALQDEKVR